MCAFRGNYPSIHIIHTIHLQSIVSSTFILIPLGTRSLTVPSRWRSLLTSRANLDVVVDCLQETSTQLALRIMLFFVDNNGLVVAWVALHGKKGLDGEWGWNEMMDWDREGWTRLLKVPKPSEDSNYIHCSDHSGRFYPLSTLTITWSMLVSNGKFASLK